MVGAGARSQARVMIWASPTLAELIQRDFQGGGAVGEHAETVPADPGVALMLAQTFYLDGQRQ